MSQGPWWKRQQLDQIVDEMLACVKRRGAMYNRLTGEPHDDVCGKLFKHYNERIERLKPRALELLEELSE